MPSKILTKRISCAEFMKVPPRKPKARLGCRHLQIFLMTTGFLCCYAMRITMSVAIVAMVDAESSNPDYEEYNWSMAIQSTILSSFFWGYVLTQIPGGMIAQRWGARNIYGYAVCFCAIFSLGIPLAARYGGWQLVCACRVAMGLCQGAVLPILHTLLAKWAPLDERGTLGSFVYSGGWIGNVSSLLSSSFLAASPLGWPSCFYFWGILSFLWSIIWMAFGSECPAEDARISDEEKEYIEVSLGVTESTEPLKTPWLAIARSPAVWAIAMAQCAQAWGFWTLVSEIPSYLNSVLEFDIKEVGLYSALSYFTAWILGFPVSFVSDYFIKSKIISTTTSRKLCNTFGQWIPAIALIGLGFVRSDQQVVGVAILVVAVGTNIAIYCGHNVNHMDLSPNFAGTLMGCINAVANICGIVTPLIAGAIVTEKSNILQWRIVFTLSAGIYFLGNLGYLIFGSATVQKWNDLGTKTRALSPHEQAAHKLATKIIGKDAGKTLIIIGSSKVNSPIRGYVRSPQPKLLEALKARADVLEINEFRTTKAYCNCHKPAVTSTSPHRYQFCPNCDISYNRDVNAGINILNIGIAHHILGHQLPQ